MASMAARRRLLSAATLWVATSCLMKAWRGASSAASSHAQPLLRRLGSSLAAWGGYYPASALPVLVNRAFGSVIRRSEFEWSIRGTSCTVTLRVGSSAASERRPMSIDMGNFRTMGARGAVSRGNLA